MKFHSWTGNVDADESFWYEEGKYGTYFLNIIRLFYEQGTPAYEEVGKIIQFFLGFYFWKGLYMTPSTCLLHCCDIFDSLFMYTNLSTAHV